MTNDQKKQIRKRAVELILAILTALIAALSTSCAVRWSSNSIEVEPRGLWSYQSMIGTNSPANK
jgi:hypothetical protein